MFAKFSNYAEGHEIIHTNDGCGIETRSKNFPCGQPAPFQSIRAGPAHPGHSWRKLIHGLPECFLANAYPDFRSWRAKRWVSASDSVKAMAGSSPQKQHASAVEVGSSGPGSGRSN